MVTSVSLRPFTVPDLDRLAGWLRESHVAPWYPRPADDLAGARAPAPGGDQAIITVGGEAVGYLRWQRVARETLDALGLCEIPAGSVDADILLGEARVLGRGIGPAALEALARELLRDANVPLLGLTTSVENTRAHRAFEKARFRIVGQYTPPGLGLCHLMVRDLAAERRLAASARAT